MDIWFHPSKELDLILKKVAKTAGIDGDFHQPRLLRTVLPETVHGLPCLDERLLKCVFRQPPVAQIQQAQP